MTVYLAYQDGRITGVYTAPERAKAAGAEEIRPVEPAHLPGSPEDEAHVLMAQGTAAVMSVTDGAFTTEVFDVGPSWGVNVQSAVAGLFGPGFIRRSVSLDCLTVYAVDRSCEDAPPLVFTGAHRFRRVADLMGECGGVPENVLKTDYLGLYFEDARRMEERLSRHGYREGELICVHLMSLAQQDAAQRGVSHFAASQMERAEVRLLNRLHNTFTPAQLKCLAHLLHLIDEPVPEADAIPEEQHALLLEKVMRFVPKLKRHRQLVEYMDGVNEN